MTSYDYDYMNFIVSVLNWAVKIKSKETDYTVNYLIPMREENPKEVTISLLLKCFYSFYCSVKNEM